MQTVSNGWKENQKQNFVSESMFELSLKVIDAGAQASAEADMTGTESYSNASYITNGLSNTPLKYATCEGVWTLDESVEILPSLTSNDYVGWVSDVLSNNDGTFASNPVLTINFDSLQTNPILGITVVFAESYGEYATDLVCRVYNGSTLSSTVDIESNSDVVLFISDSLSGYDKIELEIVQWSAGGHRARIDKVSMGSILTYTKAELLSFSDDKECDPISTGLPRDEINFSIENVDGRFNPFNPSTATAYLQQQQEVTVRYGYMINGSLEWINGGTWWLSGWELPTNGISMSFTASHLFSFMVDKYTGILNGTLLDIATAALNQANLPNSSTGGDRWVIDDSLSAYSVNITESYDYTIAETLQMVANAAMCVLYQDRNGIIRIEPLNTFLSDYPIDRDNSFEYGALALSTPLKTLTVNDLASAYAGSEGTDETLSNPFIQTTQHAQAVATWAAEWLAHRKTVSGTYRADPRLDTLDAVLSETKYSLTPLLITSLKYEYNGAFQGTYSGRIYTDILSGESFCLGGDDAILGVIIL